MANDKDIFVVRLKSAHDEKGMSPYAVSKKLGIAQNTVIRYTAEDSVITTKVEPSLMKLIRFYDLDWRDPEVLSFFPVENEEDENPTGQRKTLLAVAV